MSQHQQSPDVTDRGEHVREQRQRQLEAERRRTIDEWARLGHERITDGDWYLVERILVEKLLPETDLSERTLRRYDVALRDTDQRWYPSAIRTLFSEHPEAGSPDANPGVGAGETYLQHRPDVLERAFSSVYAALAEDGEIETDATTAVPVWEYRHQVGERYYSALSAGSDEVDLIDNDDDLKATLFTGGQGSGKSTAIETVVEDRVARGHKVIDLMDFLKAENAIYDIPPQDLDLQEIRAEMGLDVGFQEYDPPSVNVIVPLTHELADAEVPYDTEREEFVVRPFTIPASDLSYRQLVMLLPHTTQTHENYLRSAHQMLTQRGGDWTLADVAETVREETNAGDTVADRIERALETAQSKSFIRDEQVPDEYALDWSALMQDTDSIETFTMFPIDERSDRLLLASYLLDRLFEARRDLLKSFSLHEFPALTVVMRELHKIVPRSKSEQDAENTIEGYMIDTMSELIALCRHADMELLCDSQKFHQQLSADVSGLFHRIFAFGGQKPDIKQVFRTRVDNTDPAAKVARYDAGRCALVSGDGYTMPIQMAPPRCHHLDAKTDGNGLGFRTRHPSLSEKMRDAPWDASIPARLQFDELAESPIGRFWREYVRETGDGNDRVLKDDITEAYNKWSETADEKPRSHDRLHTWIARNIDVDEGTTRKHDREPDKKRCYWGVELTF